MLMQDSEERLRGVDQGCVDTFEEVRDDSRQLVLRRLGVNLRGTQKQLAEDLGVSQSLISKVKKGERKLTRDALRILKQKLSEQD